jgi:hypothetical protein
VDNLPRIMRMKDRGAKEQSRARYCLAGYFLNTLNRVRNREVKSQYWGLLF